MSVVEDVVAFHTDLHVAGAIARYGEVLANDEIGVVDSGTVVPVAGDIAEAADRLGCEGGGLEEGNGVVAGACGVDIHLAQIALDQGSGLVGNIRAGVVGRT